MFLAYHLAALRREYRLAFEEQAHSFGLDVDSLVAMAICRL